MPVWAKGGVLIKCGAEACESVQSAYFRPKDCGPDDDDDDDDDDEDDYYYSTSVSCHGDWWIISVQIERMVRTSC